MDCDPSLLAETILSGKRDLYTGFQVGIHPGRGWRHSRHWLPICPLLPQDRQGDWKNRTLAWRAPSAPKEGAEDGLQTRGPKWGCCGSQEKGWPAPEVSRRGRGRGGGHTGGLGPRPPPTPSRDLGLPTRQRVTPRHPAGTPQPGPAGGWQVRGRGAPGLQCARR